MKRILYFDIDGTINDYNDRVKPRLANGVLQRALEQSGFDELVCVSGWATMFLDAQRFHPIPNRSADLVERIRLVVEDAFPDESLFRQRCTLKFENDNRALHIETNADWYFIDDWAQEFFEKDFGAEAYSSWHGTRILQCDPFGDGTDVLEFIQRLNGGRS